MGDAGRFRDPETPAQGVLLRKGIETGPGWGHVRDIIGKLKETVSLAHGNFVRI